MYTSPMLYDSVTSPRRQNQAKWAADGTAHADNFEARVDRGLNKTNIYIYLQYIRYIYIHNSGMRMS